MLDLIKIMIFELHVWHSSRVSRIADMYEITYSYVLIIVLMKSNH